MLDPAMIEENPRKGVELREPAPLTVRDLPAVILAFWLVGATALALFAGIVWPALVLSVIALAWPSPASARPVASRRRRRRMTRAGITAAALVGWAAIHFGGRSL